MKLTELLTESEHWNEKLVLDHYGDYRFVGNSIDDPHYFTMWTDDNQKVGSLSLYPIKKNGELFMQVDSVDVDTKHRRKGLAQALYRLALKHIDSKYAGIYSYLPNTAHKAPHKIHKRLGGEVIDGDHMFIRRIAPY